MKIDFEKYNVVTTSEKTKKFINRELSWLEFNNRVLYCANNRELPLNERFNFLGISCSNLTEFISVRYSNALNDKTEPVKRIHDKIIECMSEEERVYNNLLNEIKNQGITISSCKELPKKERGKVSEIFQKEIFPLLTPVTINTSNDIPNLYNGQVCVIVVTKRDNGQENIIMIPINKNIDTMYTIENNVLMIEDIVINHLDNILINKTISEASHFRVIKDNNIILSHDTSKFILDRMISTLEKRKDSNVLFLQTEKYMSNSLRKILIKLFNISKSNVYYISPILDYTRFSSHKLLPNEYSYKSFESSGYNISNEKYSLFNTLNDKDILLQHPYDSYDTIIKFIEHGAVDPKVLAIKQTLYRVSSEDSPIINALCRAARMGKTVSVLVEIKARFDENLNISIISKLEKSGVNVLLGNEYLKTHCKMCLIVRKENDKLKIYSHVATGNYNEKTAKIYTDISYLTSKQKIGMDLLHIFNILSGNSTPDEKLQRVFYAPITLRKKMIKNIQREIDNVKDGNKGEIFLKLNSINDSIIINKLYDAAKKGVKIYIISRGICSIVPTKNIYIKSIVGRFLEHSRIYYFANNKSPEYYISSADMLTRNLDKRVETLISILDNESIKKLSKIISVFKADEKNSFKMLDDGSYKHINGDFDCHQHFIDNSL